MRKKVFRLLVIMLFTLAPVVKADAVPITSLPKDYSNNNFNYTIEGLELRIYDASEDADGNSKYMTDKAVLYTIPISDDTITINPTEYVGKYGNSNGTFINLNLNVDGEKIKQLMKTKITTLDDKEAYISELVVKYKMSTIPGNYSYHKHVNLYDTLIALFSNKPDPSEKVEIGQTTTQVINLSMLYKENGEEKFVYDQSQPTDTDSTDTGSVALLDLLYLSNDDNVVIGNTDDIPDSYVFVFHNLSNLEEILNSDFIIKNTDPNSNNNIVTTSDNKDVVKVEDTAMSTSIMTYLFGIISLIVGTSIVIYMFNENKKQEV